MAGKEFPLFLLYDLRLVSRLQLAQVQRHDVLTGRRKSDGWQVWQRTLLATTFGMESLDDVPLLLIQREESDGCQDPAGTAAIADGEIA